MSQRVVSSSRKNHANMVTKRRYSFHYGVFKIPNWFYSFVPFKIATGGSSVLMPLYLLQLGGSAQLVGVMNSLASLASMIGTLFWGRLSDKTLKRRLFITLGFSSVSIFLALLAIVGSAGELIILNTLYAFFLATTISVPVVLALRSVRKTYWDFGLGKFSEIGGWGWTFGLVLGLALSKYLSISALLLLFAIINFPSILLGASLIREIPIYVNRESIALFRNAVVQKARYAPSFVLHIPSTLKGFRRFSKCRAFYAHSFLFWIATGLYFSQVPVFLTFSGFSREKIYLIAIANSAISAFMYTRVGLMLKNDNLFKVLRRGLLLRFLGIAAIFIAVVGARGVFILALASYLLAGLSWSFISISGTSLVGRLAGEKEKGTAMGIYNLVNSLGLIVGSLSSGFIVEGFGFGVEYALALLFVLLSLLPIRTKAL
ncbi:hypothetical protein PAP_06075 [Palaeococcus pacificus DY20341]|uniref:Major facilitator superfamily (MFS) profile domain-containing protein n=1 Tax=Palaeococcus pacificus DY20341 TaxID=1343739 RepID=A0A075LSA1_9EURY|nr:MFS transporter [Palaeococcus pacificus]AIF69615.1 hypothetical protein PAP_06075 [Palaeococcus pacificus DY20341]